MQKGYKRLRPGFSDGKIEFEFLLKENSTVGNVWDKQDAAPLGYGQHGEKPSRLPSTAMSETPVKACLQREKVDLRRTITAYIKQQVCLLLCLKFH